MIATLSRRYRFSASHRLHAGSLSQQENARVYGKCNNPYGHGHNYIVTLSLRGPIHPQTGMVTDLAALDRFAAGHLLARYHLANLNTVEPFTAIVPSTENLTLEIHRIFSAYPGATLASVHVEETGNNSFEYTQPQPQRKANP